jgi:hypothetical protein
MIAICGLPTRNFNSGLVETAFQAYRDKENRGKLLASLGPEALYDATIKMVGVWETVGSLGIPSAVFQAEEPVYGFLDTSLHPDVRNAYQALAIDERRNGLPATLWGAPATAQVLEQVWFTGVHGDVGGGYPETGLSDITLSWMLSKAVALGMEVDQDAAKLYLPLPVDSQQAIDKIHDSWNPAWGLESHRPIWPNSTIGNSVAVRVAAMSSYRPSNLNIIDNVLAPSYQLEQVVAQAPDSEAVARAQETENPDVGDQASNKFRSTYAAFEGDLVSFDQQSFKEPLKD